MREDLRPELEVAVDRVVEAEAVRLRPADEAALPVVPAAGGAPHRDLVVGEIGLQAAVVRVGLRRDIRDAAVEAVGVDRLRTTKPRSIGRWNETRGEPV